MLFYRTAYILLFCNESADGEFVVKGEETAGSGKYVSLDYITYTAILANVLCVFFVFPLFFMKCTLYLSCLRKKNTGRLIIKVSLKTDIFRKYCTVFIYIKVEVIKT